MKINKAIIIEGYIIKSNSEIRIEEMTLANLRVEGIVSPLTASLVAACGNTTG